jgi:signal transduction histidine kinase
MNEHLGAGIDNALAAVQMMQRLIEDLMDSMRLDTSFRMNFQEVDMTLLVADVVRTLRYPIEEKDVGVRIEPMPVIEADEWALTKAFMNLLGNAIQYAAPDRRPRVWINYEEQDDVHVVSIRDNGMGIPEGQSDKLFMRFQRGSNVAGISGTGLGLHIVKEVVMGHGGQITVESVEGKGTTFRLHLPKKPVEVPQSAVTQTMEL